MIVTRIDSILKFYESEGADVKKRLADILNHGALGGSGKLIISAVDQGFEHGPSRSFAQNDGAYDPFYHFNLAIEGGLSAFAAPLGMLESGAETFKGKIPTILKINSCNALYGKEPDQAITASVEDAVRLGCHGIGFTLYPGSDHNLKLINEFREVAHQAKKAGLVVVAWSYPRGSSISKDGETSLDVISYGAHMACLLGAHIVKVKVPTDHLFLKADTQAIKNHKIPHTSLKDRIRYVVKCCFEGRRIVIFSGGTAKNTDDLMEETKDIRDGQGFGSIVGRNFFQRERQEALYVIQKMVALYKED
ncbi:MAG: class I fructose-bisphosphate aldolase [Holosporaceae bacterium]|nr:MAG: class I fructose-bisphosphate aldolase [Holosporaceae bacterium]